MSWEGVKNGEQKKMRSGATAWRSVGKGWREEEWKLGKAGEVCKWVKCICNQQIEQGEGASIEI